MDLGCLEGMCDRKLGKRVAPRTQPHASETGQGLGRSLRGPGQGQEARGQGRSSVGRGVIGGEEELTQRRACWWFPCGSPSVSGEAVLGKAAQCVGSASPWASAGGPSIAHMIPTHPANSIKNPGSQEPGRGLKA